MKKKTRNRMIMRLTAALTLLCAVMLAGCGIPSGLIEENRTPLPVQTGGDNPFADPTGHPQPDGTYPNGSDSDPAGPENSGAKSIRTTLYYVTDEGYILPVRAEIPWEEGIAKACLMKLVATPENSNVLKKEGLNAPIPAGTEIQLAIDEGEARVNLQNMPALSDYRAEQNLFTSVINTLTEFSSIKTVSVFINGSTAKTANGSDLPSHSGKLALNVENGAVAASGSAKPVTLYFPNGSGGLIVPVTRYSESGGLYSAICALAAGTELPGLRGCFPENTLVLGAAIENGVLTVNLSKDFLSIAETPGLYGLAMHTVLLTAQPYGSIDEVVFTVNGTPYSPDA